MPKPPSHAPVSGVGMHVVSNQLVVPIQGELYDDTLELLQREILNKVYTAEIQGVILDVSALPVMDSFAFTLLTETAKMVSLQGAEAVFVGFQPGVVSALMDLDAPTDGLNTALTLEDGFELIRTLVAGKANEAHDEFSQGFSEDISQECPENAASPFDGEDAHDQES